MITKQQYFGDKLKSEELVTAGMDLVLLESRVDYVLLPRVNGLLKHAHEEGVYFGDVDPDTGTEISGSHNGQGDGGFRLPGTSTGAPNSKHKLALAVDVYDPEDALDNWLTDEILAQHGLYREHPDATPGWCHLQCVRPNSGHRTYKPF